MAYTYELLYLNLGLLYGRVTCSFGLLGFHGRCFDWWPKRLTHILTPPCKRQMLKAHHRVGDTNGFNVDDLHTRRSQKPTIWGYFVPTMGYFHLYQPVTWGYLAFRVGI